MPGTDKPKKPRGKEVVCTDKSRWMNCGDEVSAGSEIYDYIGNNDEYGAYIPTPTGTYTTSGGQISVVDGIIQPPS